MKNKLFLTSMLAMMVASPAFAVWPTGVGTVGVDTTTGEIDTSSSTASGYIGGNMSGSNANCTAVPLQYQNTNPTSGQFTLTAQWEPDRCPVTLDLNLANGGAANTDPNAPSTSVYRVFQAIHDDGAYPTWDSSWTQAQLDANRMTTSTNGYADLPVGQTVSVTWDTNAESGQTVTTAQGSSLSLSATRPFQGFFASATGSNSTPYFSWNSTSNKLFITSDGIDAAKAVGEVNGSCPDTRWYAHWGCVNVTKPSVSSTGYDFVGWYTASTGGTALGDNLCWTESDSGTYYARWTPKHYTVTYNSGTCKATASTVYTDTGGATYNQNYTVPAAANTAFGSAKTGYTFVGWNTVSGQTTTNFPTATETPWTHDDGITVYAACTANDYTITYSCGGGSFKSGIPAWTAQSGTADTVTYDASYGFTRTPTNTCEWTGHAARPTWSCVQTGTQNAVLTTWPSAPTNWNLAYNVTCTAQWNDIINLVWDYDNDVDSPTNGTCEYSTTGTIVVPAEPSRNGYKFKGWLVTDHQ